MKKYLFSFFWLAMLLLVVAFAFYGKSNSNAMVARVESRVISVSFASPVLVQQILTVPGQRISKGDTLMKVVQPDLDLKIKEKEKEIEDMIVRLRRLESEHQLSVSKQNADYINTKQKLLDDLQEWSLVTNEMKAASNRIAKLTNKENIPTDSLVILKVESAKKYLEQLEWQHSMFINGLRNITTSERSLIVSRNSLLQLELDNLINEKKSLTYLAEISGTVGNVFVEVNELASPYKKLMSVYELRPSLIKAFVNEGLAQELEVGGEVRVSSANREIQTNGIIEEIGTRVTDYPSQITGLSPVYGQEVFVRISGDHEFLDGEKVFVYPSAGK